MDARLRMCQHSVYRLNHVVRSLIMLSLTPRPLMGKHVLSEASRSEKPVTIAIVDRRTEEVVGWWHNQASPRGPHALPCLAVMEMVGVVDAIVGGETCKDSMISGPTINHRPCDAW